MKGIISPKMGASLNKKGLHILHEDPMSRGPQQCARVHPTPNSTPKLLEDFSILGSSQ